MKLTLATFAVSMLGATVLCTGCGHETSEDQIGGLEVLEGQPSYDLGDVTPSVTVHEADETEPKGLVQVPTEEDDEISQSEDADIDVNAIVWDSAEVKYGGTAHQKMTQYALDGIQDSKGNKWFSSPRMKKIVSASSKPDSVQGKESAEGELSPTPSQTWSHSYLLSSLKTWIWGDANEDFRDNLDGADGNEDGNSGKSAGYYYGQKNQQSGDWYVGYATHYIQDCSFVLHTTAPVHDGMGKEGHAEFELWLHNNISTLAGSAKTNTTRYGITDPASDLESVAIGSGYVSSDLGAKVWNAWIKYQENTGSTSAKKELVTQAAKMVRRSVYYTRGTIWYAMEKYGQWGNTY